MIDSYVALDIETTGLNPAADRIIEIGMARVCNGNVTDTYSTLVNPGIPYNTIRNLRINIIHSLGDRQMNDTITHLNGNLVLT